MSTTTYELEVAIKRLAARPFRLAAIEGEQRVQEIASSFLAAWGIPVPASLQDTAESAFADRLAEGGEFTHEEQGYRIVAKRSN